MYTFKDLDTGKDVELVSVNKLILETAKDYVSGEPSAYYVSYNGDKHRVEKAFYDKIKKEKGL